MSQIQIKHRYTGAVLFECDVPDEVASGLRMRYTLERAVEARAKLADANLAGANLADANLAGANLAGAYLAGAYLAGAYLAGADIKRAKLADANLAGANLADANLAGAYLAGAYLAGAKLADANLAGAYLADAYLAGANLARANLAGAYLAGANLADAVNIRAATNEQAIENLDKVRAIVLDDKARLNMGHWHGDDDWVDRTCAEEALCGTTHCMAGWLQVCSTDPEIRGLSSPAMAGTLAAPIASKMFCRGQDEALTWLESRQYVADIAEHEQRVAKDKARYEAEIAARVQS